MVQYKLNYFEFRGRGELIRFIFHAAGQEFTDRRIKMDDWPGLKASSPNGQLPFLEITDGDKTTVMIQSMAIARYLARKLGLVGKDDLESGIADMYAEQIHDLLNEFGKCHFEKDEARKKEMTEKFQNEMIPNSLKLFEKQLSANNGHFSGSQLTYADLYLVIVLDFMGEKKDSILEQFSSIKKLYETVCSQANIKAYLDQRPKSDI